MSSVSDPLHLLLKPNLIHSTYSNVRNTAAGSPILIPAENARSAALEFLSPLLNKLIPHRVDSDAERTATVETAVEEMPA